MDCAWDDGIPGSDRKDATGLSWLSIFLRICESTLLATAPSKAHIISGSCFQRAATANEPATSHLLCCIEL
uniref:Uncharacterized protein n=1 Tax=Arundo donax TaxID=35708 RepID=A0A0A9GQJ3_ARUDO